MTAKLNHVPKVDSEFSSLCPRLSDDELSGLRESLRQDGYHKWEPILICKSLGNVIIDGHHRWELCGYLDIVPVLEDRHFNSREAAANWIIDRQLSRRNLTPDQLAYLRGKKYSLVKQPKGRIPKQIGQNARLITAEQFGEKFGVSECTIRRDAQFSKAVDSIEEVHGKIMKDKLLSGKLGFSKGQVVATSQLPKSEQSLVLAGKATKPRDVGSRHKKRKSGGCRGGVDEAAQIDEICNLLHSLIQSLVQRNGSADAIKNLKFGRKLIHQAKSQLHFTGVAK